MEYHLIQPYLPFYKTMKEPTTLKAGDIRQEGDLVRAFNGAANSNWKYEEADQKRQWRPVTLPGRIILQSDLLHLEYLRP